MSYTSFRNDQPGDAQPGLLRFQRTNNFGSVAANNLLGEILWEGFDATVPPGQFKSASYIRCQAVGAPAGNVPSELQFNTSFGTGTQLAMTIDQYGQVTINNPAANEATLFVTNDQTSANINLRTSNATPTNSPHIHFTRSRVAAADVQASDDLGRLEFRGFQGGTAIEAADIRAQAETVNGASVSGSLQFRTRPTTYAALNTRMNISADGNVTISTPISGTALNINGIASGIAAEINNVGTSLNFSSTGQRITADMSNATHANRLAFQSNVLNGATSPFILPNGTSQTASIIVSNNSTPTNSAFAQLQVDSLSTKIVSGVLGTGTLLPFELRIGSANTAVSISTNRNVTINAPVSGTALTVTGQTGSFAATFTGTNAGGISVEQSTGGASSYQAVQSSVDVQPVYFNAFKNRAGGDINAGDILMQHNVYGYRGTYQTAGAMRCYAETVAASRVSAAFDWFTTSTTGVLAQRLYLSSDGAVVINSPAAAQTALFVNGYNATGTYGAQFSAVVPGALFDGIRVINNTTTAGSSSQIECAVDSQALTTGGDPYLRFVNYGVNAVSIGLDTSTQQLAMTSGSGVGGGGNFFTWSIANNQINLPLQISFGAFLQPGLANQTGAGGAPDIAFNVVTSNVGSAYNAANGRVTAPVDGKYLIGANVTVDAISAAMTVGSLQFWRYNAAGVALAAYAYNYINPAAVKTPTDVCSFQGHIVIPMNATDYVTVKCILENGAGNTAGYTGFGARETSIYGQLLS